MAKKYLRTVAELTPHLIRRFCAALGSTVKDTLSEALLSAQTSLIDCEVAVLTLQDDPRAVTLPHSPRSAARSSSASSCRVRCRRSSTAARRCQPACGSCAAARVRSTMRSMGTAARRGANTGWRYTTTTAFCRCSNDQTIALSSRRRARLV